MSDEKLDPQYSADSIQALEGMEHVRMRPSMYIGDVGARGLHHLVYEVVDNSIDEALGGYCDTISVIINEDNSITTEDNGRGIPVGMHKKEGVSALEVVMTKIGAGGKFDKDTYFIKFPSGMKHGHDYLKSRPLFLSVHCSGYSSSIISNCDRVIFVNVNLNRRTMSRKRLVN